MKRLKFSSAVIGLVLFIIGCNSEPAAEKDAAVISDSAQVTTAKTDPAQLKKEIQEQETAWSHADNARDVNAIAAFYADDAISLESDQPMQVGNAAIKKGIEASLAKRPKGATLSYEVMDAYGDDDHVAEVGKTTRMDSTGKVTSTGKYMAIWEKRNGKWICIRDIGNDDAKKN